MLRKNLKLMLAAAVGIAGVAFDASQANAGWRHRGSWGSGGGSWGSGGGSWGSGGGSWGSGGGSWGSGGGSWGSSGGSWGGNRWHRAHYSGGGSWGSSGGGWGSSGGSSGGNAAYGSSGGGWGSSGGSSDGGVIYGEPSYGEPSYGVPHTPSAPSAPTNGTTPPSNTDAPPTPMPGSVYRRLGGDNLAMLNVNVPAEAKVFVNGAATTSTGLQRQFVSRGLNADNRYTYEVRAEMVRDGETLTETKSVTLGSGEQARLAFSFDKSNAPVAAGAKTKTKLTVRVPAEAKVFLSGRETSSTGDVREFSTTKLATGAEWNDYTVRVVATIDGREVTKEETITLIGGEDRELNIGFGSTEIAQTAAVTR